MKKLVTGIALLISSASYANEMQFQFKSPAFNGVGYSAHVLTIENLEQTRKQKQIDDAKAAAAKETYTVAFKQYKASKPARFVIFS